jgi:DNA-binding MarR family transcriptional regulator
LRRRRASRSKITDVPNTSDTRIAPGADASPVDFLPCACATIRRASRAVTQLYDQWLRVHGIEAPQFALLAVLERLGEANQKTMGQRFDLDKTTLSRNLKLLKQKGWIETVPGGDGRERRVRLTTSGRRQLAVARPTWKKAQAQMRAALSEHDWETTLHVLNAITDAARRAQRP